MDSLTDAQVLLLAAQLTASSNLTHLQVLTAARRDVLSSTLVYRMLLTFLPLDDDPNLHEQLISLIHNVDHDFRNFSTIDTHVDIETNDLLSAAEAEHSLSGLQLEKLPVYDSTQPVDILTDFVIAWIHKAAEFGGISGAALALAEPFTDEHTVLRSWFETILQPLYRLRFEAHGSDNTRLTLEELENAHGEAGVRALLGVAAQSNDPSKVARDLDDVVKPWVVGAKKPKRRKLSTSQPEEYVQKVSFADVNEWLLSTSQQNFDLAAGSVQEWNGPSPSSNEGSQSRSPEESRDGLVDYIRTILALVYVSNGNDSIERILTKQRLLLRSSNLAQLMPPDFEVNLPDIPDTSDLQQASRSDLMSNTLLSESNVLTRPSSAVVDFLSWVLATQSVLKELKIESATRSVASTALFDSEERQKNELASILAQIPRLTKSAIRWSELRAQLLWLSKWSYDDSLMQNRRNAYLGHLSRESIELGCLEAMLVANAYEDAQSIYLKTDEQPLPAEKVQQCVLDAVLSSYDNASNGNRTRGGVKKAVELLQAFKSSFPDAETFAHLDHLIKATHSLSFYQLILQHGVPFRPVSIRVSKDPLSLVEKVLDQNNKAYTQLEDLLGIARDLVLADLPTPVPADLAPGEPIPLERRLFDAEHRITYAAITAALTDNDFDTAYSLITTRLGRSPSTKVDFEDDTTWRAAYAAGRFKSTSSPQDIHKQISSLQKRMELLSKALILAPNPDPLPDILVTWRKCEEEVDNLKAQAIQEERAADAQMDSQLPGGFGPSDLDLDADETKRMVDSRRAFNATGPSYEEEAPMGLFDVAKGAASALRKNAFPLRGAARGQNADIKVRDQPRQVSGESQRNSGEFDRPGSAGGERVRKRDMLSNAVTGGLVSGMSWVLGAQPAGQQQKSEYDM